MTNEEKVLQILSNNGYHEGNVIDVDNAMDMLIQMAEWKDEQYKVLIDYIVELTNDCGGDCEPFSECMPEWCEKNCGSHNPNFNAECIKNWIKKQNENKK